MLTNPRVWRDDHLPRRLVARDTELHQLCRAWQPALQEPHRVEDVLLAGPSGVGKTTVARYALEELHGQGVPTTVVDCLGQNDHDILTSVLDAHPETSTPANGDVDDLLDRLRGLDRGARPLIVLLDEADGLPGGRVIREVVRRPTIASVAVCHDPDNWLARSHRQTREAYRGHRLTIDRYTDSELADILEARAEQGLLGTAWTRRLLEDVADRAAGVARVGIQGLRAAAVLAGERGHPGIREIDVEDGLVRAREEIRRSKLASMPFHHQVLYGLVLQARGTIDGGVLHDRYELVKDRVYRDRVETPIGRRARRNKLEKLREYGLIADDGDNRHTEYRAVDPELEPAIEVDGLSAWAERPR